MVVKRAVALIALGLYVAASAWFVRSAGESYRRSLLESRDRASIVGPSPETTVPAPIAEAPARASSPGTGIAAVPPPAGSGPPSTAPDPAPARSSPAPPPSTATASRPAARPSVWDSPKSKAIWDPDKLSPDDEIRLGQDVRELILTLNRPVEGGPWQRRVEEAAEPLLALRARKEIPCTFTVLDSGVVNAFSHPGGFVYVSKGLFDLIGEDEEPLLQFILAHEIAHIDLGHARACLASKDVRAMKLGTIETLYGVILPHAYPDALEYEADRRAYDQMLRLGHSRLEAVTFLRRFEDYAKSHGFENGRDHRPPEPGAALVDFHYRAHPAAYKRVKELMKVTTSSPAPAPKSSR